MRANKPSKRRINYRFLFLVTFVLLVFSVLLNIKAVKLVNETMEQAREAIAVAEEAQRATDIQTIKEINQESYEEELSFVESPDSIQDSFSNSKTITVVATAYCPCVSCCGIWSEEHSSRVGTGYVQHTASGTTPTAGRTIATDPEVIPTGSRVLINGKEYIAEDTGGAIKGNRIDVFFDTHEEALNWGKQTLEVTVIED